jgi:predicted RNase H-like HicB family nuclease
MVLQGRVWKEDKFWLIEIPLLDLMTQGETRGDALVMISDAIKELSNSNINLKIKCLDKDGHFYLQGENPEDLLPFILRRIRESEGISIREAAKRLKLSSHNAYARYENGEVKMPIGRFEKYLKKLKGLELVLSAINLKNA